MILNCKIFGIWSYFWGGGFPQLPQTDGNKLPAVLKIKELEYIENGRRLLSKRSGHVVCPFTHEVIGFPAILTDGDWMWSREFLFYAKNYGFGVPTEFLRHMALKDFQVPTTDGIGKGRLDKLYNCFEALC